MMPTRTLRWLSPLAFLALWACDDGAPRPPLTVTPAANGPAPATVQSLRDVGVEPDAIAESIAIGRAPLGDLALAMLATDTDRQWEEPELILRLMWEAFTRYRAANGGFDAPNPQGLQAAPGTSGNYFSPVIGFQWDDTWTTVSPADFTLSILSADRLLIVVSPATDGRDVWSQEVRRINQDGVLDNPGRGGLRAEGDTNQRVAAVVAALQAQVEGWETPFLDVMGLAVALVRNRMGTSDFTVVPGLDEPLVPGPATAWLGGVAPEMIPLLEADAQRYSLDDFRLLAVTADFFLLAFSPEFDGREVWSGNWLTLDQTGELRLVRRDAGALPRSLSSQARSESERWEPARRLLRGIVETWRGYADRFGAFDAAGPGGRAPHVGDRLDRLGPLLPMDISLLRRLDDFSAASFAVVALGPYAVQVAAMAPFSDQALVIDQTDTFTWIPIAQVPPQTNPVRLDPSDE